MDLSKVAAQFLKCKGCSEILFYLEVESNSGVCPRCLYHFQQTGKERILATVDLGSFDACDENIHSANPLGWPEFTEKLKAAMDRTGTLSGIISGIARIENMPVCVFATDFRFMGGTIGSAEGEKICRTFERALDLGFPVVGFTSSGGARVQEGLFSLMQVAKVVSTIGQFRAQGGRYISVLTDPVMGGPMISFALLADLRLAEPLARISFAGGRVKGTDRERTGEDQLEWGAIDEIVHRQQLRNRIVRYLSK